MRGEDGADTLIGDGGQDFLYGGNGPDWLEGGAGNDFLYGDDGNDTLIGGGDNDLLSGLNGNDSLFGGDGQDTLYSGLGVDTLDGGDGNDFLILSGTDSPKFVSGGPGNDTLGLALFTWGSGLIHVWTFDGKHELIDPMTGSKVVIAPDSDIEMFVFSSRTSVPIAPIEDEAVKRVPLELINSIFGVRPPSTENRQTVTQDLLVIFDTGRVTDLKVHKTYSNGQLINVYYSRNSDVYQASQIEPFTFVVEVDGRLTEGFKKEFAEAFPLARPADLDSLINHDVRLIAMICGADGNYIG